MTAIAGKTAVVTRAASGMGRLIALGLARRGARVVGWDVREGPLEEVRRALDGAGPGPHGAIRCDVSERDEIERAAARTRREHGPVDILVNNAGVVSGRRLLDIADAEIEQTMRVNALAPIWTTRAFLPDMIARRRGHLVTIASAAGLIGAAGLADYAASKFAAVGFDESLRMELRRIAPRVRTTLVCPFFVSTGMFAGVTTRFPRLLPILDPEEVARAVVSAVRRNRRLVVLPPVVRLLPALRLLPVGVFDRIATFLGVNAAMDTFQGRERSPDAAGDAPRAGGPGAPREDPHAARPDPR